MPWQVPRCCFLVHCAFRSRMCQCTEGPCCCFQATSILFLLLYQPSAIMVPCMYSLCWHLEHRHVCLQSVALPHLYHSLAESQARPEQASSVPASVRQAQAAAALGCINNLSTMFSMLRSNLAVLDSSASSAPEEQVSIAASLEKAIQQVQPFCQVSKASFTQEIQQDCFVHTDSERCISCLRAYR